MADSALPGSEPPAGDTLGVLAARHLDCCFRALMRPPQAEQCPEFMRFVSGAQHPMGNIAVISDPSRPEVVRAAVEPLARCGAPSAAIFPYGVPDAAAEVVRGLGLAAPSAMPAMAVEIAQLAPTALPPGYAWARVGTGSEGEAWADALAVGYGLPRRLADVFSPAALGADPADDAPVQFFAALRDGRPVATVVLYLAEGLAGIYCVSTLPDERRHGLGAHVTAEALRVAGRLGYRTGVLQSSTAGYPVYLRLGFGDYGRIPMFIRMAA